MDVGPIPWNFIADYGDRLGLDGQLHRTFCAVIRAMDAAWLAENRQSGASAPNGIQTGSD